MRTLIEIDGDAIRIERDGKQVAAFSTAGEVGGRAPSGAAPVVPPQMAPVPGQGVLDGSYFHVDDLRRAAALVKPAWGVTCDSNRSDMIFPGPEPFIPFGSVEGSTTVNLMVADHPHFKGQAALAAPIAPVTVVGASFVPGVSILDPSVKAPPNLAPRFFVHGPAVGVNAQGQPIDAEGRTAGPLPPVQGASELAQEFRLKAVTIGGVRYDAWGNRISDGTAYESLDPVYGSLADLQDAAEGGAYPVAIAVASVDGGVVWTHPGFGPADRYVTQPDGRVERVN